jgi:hypothetical protein
MPDAPYTLRDGFRALPPLSDAYLLVRDGECSEVRADMRRWEPCLVVAGDLDMARELLSMGGALVAGRVAMVLPSGTTDEQGERIRLAIRTIIDGARLAPPVVSGDARTRAMAVVMRDSLYMARGSGCVNGAAAAVDALLAAGLLREEPSDA